jgi:uncharacterized protein YmfQ (DUF2313 family)
MSDDFQRLLVRPIPISFYSSAGDGIGRPRVYSVDPHGTTLGNTTPTYAFNASGDLLSTRSRNGVEAAWGTPSGAYGVYAVGRLSDGQTLYYWVNLSVYGGGTRPVVGAPTDFMFYGLGESQFAVGLPSGIGRRFISCCLSSDGSHLFYITAPAEAAGGSATGDMWHLCAWTGSAWTAVREGTVEQPWIEYDSGPGSTAQFQDRACIMESDRETVWKANGYFRRMEVLRIGTDGVLRVIHLFPDDPEAFPLNGGNYPSLFADRGLCAIVCGDRLSIYSRGYVDTSPIGPHDDLLRRLLPPLAIDRNGMAIAAELTIYGAKLDAAALSADMLLAEADPRTTSGLLADWERVYGLEGGAAISLRRSALIAQILAGGGQSRAFYVQLAAALGYTATIMEFTPHTVNSSVVHPLYDMAWRFGWRVTAHPELGASSTAALEALIRRLAPAHTFVQFAYI